MDKKNIVISKFLKSFFGVLFLIVTGGFAFSSAFHQNKKNPPPPPGLSDNVAMVLGKTPTKIEDECILTTIDSKNPEVITTAKQGQTEKAFWRMVFKNPLPLTVIQTSQDPVIYNPILNCTFEKIKQASDSFILKKKICISNLFNHEDFSKGLETTKITYHREQTTFEQKEQKKKYNITYSVTPVWAKLNVIPKTEISCGVVEFSDISHTFSLEEGVQLAVSTRGTVRMKEIPSANGITQNWKKVLINHEYSVKIHLTKAKLDFPLTFMAGIQGDMDIFTEGADFIFGTQGSCRIGINRDPLVYGAVTLDLTPHSTVSLEYEASPSARPFSQSLFLRLNVSEMGWNWLNYTKDLFDLF